MTIRTLPEKVYSLIAAGEVIERPSSVVRELIQNSIDAGSDSIELILRGGGRDSISVIDNGEGMDKEDLLNCIKPHSTSKIAREDDLASISTYGFRGEALHSVASVSRLTIETCADSNETAYCLETGFSGNTDISRTARQRGTTVTVNDLFRNMPARRKFLKSDSVEANHSMHQFMMYALANESIKFRLKNNSSIVHSIEKQSQQERAGYIAGPEFTDNSYSIDFFSNEMHITGYVGKPDIFSDKRTRINHMFVNRRYIYNPLVRKALYSAFDSQLSHRYLPFIIFIDIPPDLIDVNIHPAKREIKFRNEKDVFPAIINAVRSAVQVRRAIDSRNALGVVPEMNDSRQDSEAVPLFSEESSTLTTYTGQQTSQLWQFNKSYIITQLKGKLYVIDQHAAHERIMYERFTDSSELTPQRMLFSKTIKLDSELMETYEDNEDYLKSNGFITRKFGNDIILLEGVPSIIESNFTENDFTAILEDFNSNRTIGSIDDMLKLMACRTAIKANTVLSQVEMAKILSDLFRCDNPYACPHGRPTVRIFDTDEIERWFKRT